ncbi:hypothetical protein FRC09_020416 [Ceratobasidium sp. 395]|nr:hypothetical protein FRC09_020416 [Ceratobasidium sp. 395]
MDKLVSKVKQSVKKRVKKLSRRAPNSPEPLTASSAGHGTSDPAVVTTSSHPASEQINPPRSVSTEPAPHPEPNDVTQPSVVTVAPAPPVEHVAARDGWLGLDAFTRVISKLSEPFGPLKEAVDGISEVVETFEVGGMCLGNTV